jgi:hypothetical protein
MSSNCNNTRVWTWDTGSAIATIATAFIALCALGLTISASRREKKRDQKNNDREKEQDRKNTDNTDLIQPSLVHCWLDASPSTMSADYSSEVLVVRNGSNQPITQVEANPGEDRALVRWDSVGPGENVQQTVGYKNIRTHRRQICEVEFDAVSGKRWRHRTDGRLQYCLPSPSTDGREWSDPLLPIVGLAPAPPPAGVRYASRRRSYLGCSAAILATATLLAAAGFLVYYLIQH